MDKGAIKKFAVRARRELIDRVSQKTQRDALVTHIHRDRYRRAIVEVA